MNESAHVSRSRKKRTQEKTKQARKKAPIIGGKLIFCYAITLLALLVILNLGRGTIFNEYTPGQLAPSTVQALVDFETIDLAATDLRKEQAARNTPAVLRVNYRELAESKRRLDTLFAKADSQTDLQPLSNARSPSPQSFAEVVNMMGFQEGLSSLPTVLPDTTRATLKPLLEESVVRLWEGGLVSTSERESGLEGIVNGNKVTLSSEGRPIPFYEIPTPLEAAAAEAAELKKKAELNEPQTKLVELLLVDLLEANVEFDRAATEELTQINQDKVAPVLILRREGKTLMEARTTIDQQVVEDLQAHRRRLLSLEKGRNNFSQLLGQGLYLAVGLAVSLAFLYLFDYHIGLYDTNRLFLWVMLTVSSLLIGQGVIYLSSNLSLFPGHFLPSILPLALAPMLATILYGPRLGLSVGFSSSLALSMQHDLDLVIFFSGLAATVTSALTVRAIHKRSNLFRAGLWLGGIQALILFGAGSFDSVPPSITSLHALTAFGGGLGTALFVLLLVSPFEYLLNVTTDIRLLELSDMSHPLLSRLAMEAPGTYHHSLMVAHLAQAATREVRGNDLLVRVCAYYHDIGKLTKPEFFIENSSGRQNPHDDLSPSMSRLLIISHVKEGVSLAKRYKLPKAIIDGIEQHHGTSLIQYFYHRAKKQAEENESNVEAEDYRYPGPRPFTREMGILMLADSIEAASRTIDKNKPGQIEGLVHELIQDKLKDGQLDHCVLTMAEINTVRRAFVFSLNNMLHGRVKYPGKEKPAGESAPAEKPELPKATPEEPQHGG